MAGFGCDCYNGDNCSYYGTYKINSNLSNSLIYSIDIEISNNDVGQEQAPALR